MDRSELIATIQQEHERLAGIIERLPDEVMLEPAMDEWTGKDLLAHMAWWHEHSALVIEHLRTGLEPYDRNDPAFELDVLNERTRLEHLDDPPEVTRRAFGETLATLLEAIGLLSDDELFAADHWPWLEGEPLVETILWDTSRHYDAHREFLERLSGR